METTIVLAIVSGAATIGLAAAIAFLSLVWKIGRWQAQSEERGTAIAQRLDDFMERADRDIGKAHERIDDLLKTNA